MFYKFICTNKSCGAEEEKEIAIKDYDKEKEQTVKRVVSDDDKQNAENLKKSAVANLEKYLELAPDAEDRADAEELIKDCTETEDKE